MVESLPPPKPKRRWLRFRLRTLLVFVLLLSVPMGWFAWKMDRARKQREAVEAIREMGGVVSYDYQYDEQGEWIEGTEPAIPAWLRKSLGDNFFCDVTCVGLPSITDEGLEHLKGLANLKTLFLFNTQVTDAGLEHLKGLTSLEKLDLDHTEVTDAGLEHLKGLTNLRTLRLYKTQVTYDGVKKLQQALPNCKISVVAPGLLSNPGASVYGGENRAR